MRLAGCHSGEACAAKWTEVDLEAGAWAVAAADTKGERDRAVYLSPRAVEHLTAWKRSLGRGQRQWLAKLTGQMPP